ncbi:hypothetical protein Bca52824_045885 [Brassica carinata]|uniref:KIB1-4 beta-propeller domain-containing protein n=1 Tax=Brassica carinata TaxID=52824 RepID=A0A8X7URY4_BRACI|nr:hypothetical protein Bca52824_045885 [Brassica carinata]
MSLSPSENTVVVVPDWSFLPEELLHVISKNLEDCFDVVHARAVCTLWRSILPFPSYLSRPSYSLPTLDNKGFWSLEKIPLFLFRPRRAIAAESTASEYFLGEIVRDESEELPSPNQCSVKVEIPGSSDPRGVAVLPLNKEGEGDFVVLLNCTSVLMVLRSNEMRWRRFQTLSTATCDDLVTFRGRFYALFVNGDVFGFDPHFLELTPRVRLELLNCGWSTSLVPSSDDELFLVEQIIPHNGNALDFARLTLRVCRLDVEAGQWVVVKDIGDRVFIIGDLGTVSCSAKELSDGCGVCVNSILFTYGPGNVTYSYKYEDDLNCWRYSREKRATILSRSPVVALRVER